jgi:predicted Ser/Thr protein kinase
MSELLAGRYELGAVIGAGGTGLVHRATDTKLGRAVAVKILRGGPLADDIARSRMRSEAHLAASIHHPGVAQVFDFQEDGSSEEGMAFIVMQLVEGRSLAQILRERDSLPPDEVLSVVLQVAEGLQAVHDGGIVHRDLKPANIMITPAGRAVLVDFGIARTSTSEPLTETGALIGTVDYLSPEQAAGRPATTQSDLYALGIVAYHCLTGCSPFRRESHVGTALAHLNDDLPPLGANVPPAIADLVESLTAKKPTSRPTSAAAVALQAASIGAPRPIDVAPVEAAPMLMDPPTTRATAGTAAAMLRLHRRGPRRVFVGIVGVAVAAGLMAFPRLHSAGDRVVPPVVGMTVAAAESSLHTAGFAVSTHFVNVAGATKGMVVAESPKAGTRQPPHGLVALSVASGKVQVSAKDVIGHTYAEASSALEKLGFVVERKDAAGSAGLGKVVAVDKSGLLPEGATITLSVATAPLATRTTSGTVAAHPSKSPTRAGKPASKKHAKPKAKTKAKQGHK